MSGPVTVNVLIPAGTTSRPVVAGHHYRIAGILRGAQPGAVDIAGTDVSKALIIAGLTNVVLYDTGANLPDDWPDDTADAGGVPPPGTNEREFRAEGDYQGTSGQLSTAVPAGSGQAVMFLVYDDELSSNVEGFGFHPPQEDPTPSASTTSSGKTVAIIGVGAVAALLLLAGRRA